MTGKSIASVREAVEALGGTSKVAELLCVNKSAVSNYLAAVEGQGRFPPGHHLIINEELRRRGHRVDMEKLFGYVPWSQRSKTVSISTRSAVGCH